MPRIKFGALVGLSGLAAAICPLFGASVEKETSMSRRCADMKLPDRYDWLEWDRRPGGCYLKELAALKGYEAGGIDEEDREVIAGDLAELSAMVGDEAAALRHVASVSEPVGKAAAPVDPFRDAVAVPAIRAIVEAARSHRIVILNEAHHVSRHRMFAWELMRALRPLGYGYFAAEAFNGDVEAFAASIRNGVPTMGTGSYVRDPVFGNLVRDAVRSGYRLVPYEVSAADGPAPADPYEAHVHRETAQAKHLIDRIFAKDRGAKVLIYVGYSHGIEVPVRRTRGPGTAKWMAAILKERTGLDPLTVDQVSLSPAASAEFDLPEYALAVRHMKRAEPTVFKSGERLLSVGTYAGKMDMSVAHPRPRLLRGRSDWALRAPATRIAHLPAALRSGGEDRLVQVFRAGDPEDAVPVDQVIVGPDRPKPVLIVPRGRKLRYMVQ
jgi:hypothetical protein